jgi:hypothetical protein
MAKKKVQNKPILQEQPVPEIARPPFEQWWIKYRGTNGYPQGLRVAVEAHMKARGFWDSRDWDAGILDFGHGRQA